MSNGTQSMFAGLHALKERLGSAQQLEVLHEHGHKWVAAFEWKTPADPGKVEQLLGSVDVSVPEAYRRFLALGNGATLFKDSEFGQWGAILYSVDDMIAKRGVWRNVLGLPPKFLVFCEFLGDADLLLFDTSRPSPDGLDCAVVYAEEATPVSDYVTISRSFHEWLDHLIVAQGAKFWCWK